MDWDLKTPTWNLDEFEGEAISSIAPLVGSSSFGEEESRRDFSVDLKLGRLGDFGAEPFEKWKDPGSTVVPSPSKRARALSNGAQMASCLVDGCKADLRNCRDYHRRHKVCEVHSKTPKVMVGGLEQRFCQQCSRFHLLVEFDEVKRSCRKRLDGHNRRRRKAQPDSLSMGSGSFFTSHQGTALSPLSSAQIYSTPAMASHTWAGVIKTEEDTTIYNHHSHMHFLDRQNMFPGSFSQSYKGEAKWFPFMQDNQITSPPETSICQPLRNTISSSERRCNEMFSNGLTQVFNSDCALSLLSSPPIEPSAISLSHVVQPNSIPMAQLLIPGMQYGDLSRYSCSQGIDGDSGNSVLVPDYQGIFQVRPNGPF